MTEDAELAVLRVGPVPGSVRLSRLTQAERLIGGGARDPDPVWHTVAHALMNGLSRVRVVTVPGDDPGQAAQMVRRVAEDPLVGCIVAPGASKVLVDLLIAAAQVASRSSAASPWCLLDAAHASAWPAAGQDHGLRVVRPALVLAAAPGGPQHRLPATAVAGALALGAVALSPAVSLPAGIAPQTPAGAGEVWLTPSGPGGRVAFARALRRSGERPAEAAPADGSAEAPEDPLAHAIRRATESLIDGRPDGPALWRAIEVAVRAAVRPFEQPGRFAILSVRCDAELHEVAGGVPAVEVVTRTPRRVSQVTIRLSPPGG